MPEIKWRNLPVHNYPKSARGMIHYSAYWRKYSLVVDVTDYDITELDGFADINQRPSAARTRVHCTNLEDGDRLLTVAEYYREVLQRK